MNYPDPKKMMSWEEFAVTRLNSPYIYEIKSHDDKRLLFYGSRHCNNPKDVQFEDIRKRFEIFHPDIVFVEGMEDLNTPEGKQRAKHIIEQESEEETIITNGGEVGFTLRLALEDTIDVYSPEVSYKDMVQHIESKNFSRQAVFVYFITRYVCQLQRYPEGTKGPVLEEYSREEFNALKRAADWGNFEFTLENYLKTFEEITGKTFDINSLPLGDIVDPTPWPSKYDQQGITNDIARIVSSYRDEHIMKSIVEALRDYQRLFIVYGSSHAVHQEAALREFYKDQTK